MTATYLQLFDQIWNDPDKLEDVTERVCDHIASVYQENSPERIYFLMLYNIFNEFLEDISEDVLPNDLTGYQDSRDLEQAVQLPAGCGDRHHQQARDLQRLHPGRQRRPRQDVHRAGRHQVLRAAQQVGARPLPEEARGQLAELQPQPHDQHLRQGPLQLRRALPHRPVSARRGESFGIPLNRVNWGNYDLVVIDESHNFRNNDVFKDRETRYQRLMNKVIRQGVKTKVLMLSATPVNNRFTDLRNQLALAYEGDSENLSSEARHLDEHRGDLPAGPGGLQRMVEAAAGGADRRRDPRRARLRFLRAARQRHHRPLAQAHRDLLRHQGHRRVPRAPKPLSFHCPLTHRADVIGFNEIFEQLSVLKLAVYAPVSYILPSRLQKYEEIYDTEVGRRPRQRSSQADRERSLQALMTINLLKRLESSVEAFRLTLGKLAAATIAQHARSDRRLRRTARSRTSLRAFDDARRRRRRLPSSRRRHGRRQGSDQPRRHGPAVVGARPRRRPRDHRRADRRDGQGHA